MATILFAAAAICCAFLLAIVFYKYRKLSAQLEELKEALTAAREHGHYEQILLLTDERTVRELLIEVNILLKEHTSLSIRRKKQEDSERRMISNISHDLKTPLTVILGYAEMLLAGEDQLTPGGKAKIEKIYTKATDVLEMIHMFFDLAKIESGETHLEMQPVDLCEICRSEIATYYEMLSETGFDIQIQIPEAPLTVQGDIPAIKRILDNLLQNAVRYGSAGKYLGISIEEEEHNILLKVTDKGKGIVEDSQDKIFERLVTLEDSRNKKYQGSGLGLTITKRLTEAMGGSISLHSIPYKITTFTVTLPKSISTPPLTRSKSVIPRQ